jgi:hypothetical protein
MSGAEPGRIAVRAAGLLAASALVLAACAAQTRPPAGPAADADCPAPASTMARLELLFGMSRPDGRVVGEAEWLAFLEGEVIPRFPAGLTVLDGLGHWQSDDGRLTREQSKVLVIWHAPDDSAEARIEAIRAAYRQRFDQESVMRVESLSCVSF